MRIFPKKSAINDIIMVSLAIVSIFLLFYEVFANVSPLSQKYIHYIDLTIALIFLGEFLFHFIRAKDKMMFFKHRWWELLAAIPITTQTTEALRALKLARLLPLIEGMRFVRLTVRIRLLLELSARYAKHAYMIYIATIVCIVIVLGAFGFHFFEAGVNPHVHSFFDSIWWSIETMATIGYGDIYPVTLGGRIVSIIIMVFGIGALGGFIAVINSYILSKNRQKVLTLTNNPKIIDKSRRIE